MSATPRDKPRHPAKPDHPAAAEPPGSPVAVLVPHTHWDREWYAPFETMRFHLVQFLDELIDALETDPALVFLLDGQSVMLEDYTAIRPGQRQRLGALVAAGRLRPGPFYVQPDEFHVSGESVVRNLLLGLRTAREYGRPMREGYLPDTFGHVHQLPQILQGFGISTFYAMRGFDDRVEDTGSEFFWRAPDGSRVRATWLSESYSNAAVLTGDPETMSLHHGILVGYDRLPELLRRLHQRSRTGVLLLLNGGDHLRVQEGVPALVSSLDEAQKKTDGIPVQLGGLEEYSSLTAERPEPPAEISGELRYGLRHDVFDGIGSTRTPMKALHARTEARLSGIAERLDALASLTDGRSHIDALRHCWRELVKNHAHDSICGCSVDAVHSEMETRFAGIGQLSAAVTDDALARVAHAAVAPAGGEGIPVVVTNLSPFARTGAVDVAVLPEPGAPLGHRLYGWAQGDEGIDWSHWTLLCPDGEPVPFSYAPCESVEVADVLERRKEVRRDRITFTARDVPALGAAVYRLLPGDAGHGTPATAPAAPASVGTERRERSLANGRLRVEISPDGTLALTELATGHRQSGLLELLDDADTGDEYGFGPLAGDASVTSREAVWAVTPGTTHDALTATAVLDIPAALRAGRGARSAERTPVTVEFGVRLAPAADHVEVTVTVDNTAHDHRLRLRVPTGIEADESVAESAFGLVRRPRQLPDGEGWRERPSGTFALRRFAALEDTERGLAVFTEGLHEYAHPAPDTLDVTLLRAVGWMARLDHPLRPHKVGPELPTPGAQCTGRHTFRLALRPYGGSSRTTGLYRTAEELSVPLLAHAVQSARPGPAAAPAQGIRVSPADAVLSAVKTAEDGDGVLVRVFNAGVEEITAELACAFPVVAAEETDLEEQPLRPLRPAVDGIVAVPLPPGRIASVRLRTREGSR